MREATFGRGRLLLVQGDITRVTADAIVNAANSALAGGGGVDGAIHRAGGPTIARECAAVGHCDTGSAVITSAGNLPARYVIHAVAPRYRGRPEDAKLLAGAYAASMRLAEEHGLKSIAFPSLGTGAYGYPLDEAAPIALGTVAEHLRASRCIEKVTFVLFSPADLAAYERALTVLATSE
jgi:O-acetyl-ADP-ribose deacetylase (regulator of RNase III)